MAHISEIAAFCEVGVFRRLFRPRQFREFFLHGRIARKLAARTAETDQRGGNERKQVRGHEKFDQWIVALDRQCRWRAVRRPGRLRPVRGRGPRGARRRVCRVRPAQWAVSWPGSAGAPTSSCVDTRRMGRRTTREPTRDLIASQRLHALSCQATVPIAIDDRNVALRKETQVRCAIFVPQLDEDQRITQL